MVLRNIVDKYFGEVQLNNVLIEGDEYQSLSHLNSI